MSTERPPEVSYTIMSYFIDEIKFACTKCGTPMRMKAGSSDTVLSARFCALCDEQYTIRWAEGILRRGDIGEILNKNEETFTNPLDAEDVTLTTRAWTKRDIDKRCAADVAQSLHATYGPIIQSTIEEREQITMKPDELNTENTTPESLPGLTEGRNIHYVAYNNRHLAGMIIGHEANKADLVVFTNLANVNGVKNFGTQFHQDVEYSEEPKPGTWHFIEKA